MRGVTLVELLIVLAVAALLATLAVPSYRMHVLRAQRSAAMTALLDVATAQERFHLQHGRYALDSELSSAPPDGLGKSSDAGSGRYRITIEAAGTADFIVSAAATGTQLGDGACRRFTLDSLGRRGATDGAGQAASGCWR